MELERGNQTTLKQTWRAKLDGLLWSMSFVSEAIGSAPGIPSDDCSVIFCTVDCKNVNIKTSIKMINR
jgi:hypothetical protein